MATSVPAGRLPSIEPLPYGVGRWSSGWYALAGLALALVGLGVVAYSRQAMEGMVVTGLRNVGTMGGATWGLYIAFDVYFVGVSFAGITVAALIRLLRLEHLRPISRMAEALTVIALVLAGFTVLADLGQPLRALINLPLYGRPMSPFFGTFTLVIAGYLFASLVYLYLDGRRDAALCARRAGGALGRFHRLWAAGYRDTPAERTRHERTTLWLAVAILPLLVTAHSTLGFVFGIQSGRPGWYSALQAPGFVIMAGVSGIGLLIVIAALFRRLLGEEERLDLRVFRWLGAILLVLVLIYLYFMVVEWLTTSYAAHHHEATISAALVAGAYAWLFWGVVGALALAAGLLILPHLPVAALARNLIAWTVAAAILVNLAAIAKRILIVVPSQTHGTLLPYGTGSYSPTWVEWGVILGLLGLGTLLYALFVKVFPVMEVPDEATEPHRGAW